MAHGYRTLQQWNNWLAQDFLGKHLLEKETEALGKLLNKHFGKQALLIGVPEQNELINANKLPIHHLVTPIFSKRNITHLIEAGFNELPILTGSIDLVILPHTLEFLDNPRQLLTEACRVIRPEGLIAVAGFNPYSSWGLKKLFIKSTHKAPWGANFIRAQKIKTWLQLADFEMEQVSHTLFRPPIKQDYIFDKLHFLDQVGPKVIPFWGGVYLLVARAKVIPLTPIKLKWKQQLRDIRISTTISGNIARQSRNS